MKPHPQQPRPDNNGIDLVERFKRVLGERVRDVRLSNHPLQSPLRLVMPHGALQPEIQKVYRLLNQKFEPPLLLLELNIQHPILTSMLQLPPDSPILPATIELLFENALLVEGLHPNPGELAPRIQDLIQLALEKSSHE